jgi:hypothetical protein
MKLGPRQRTPPRQFKNSGAREGYEMTRARGAEVAHAYAVRLMQHLVVPTFVIDPKNQNGTET